MNRLLACTSLMTAIAAGSWFASGLAATQAPARVLEVRVGDKIQVAGAPLGCHVLRAEELDDRIAVECRRAGALAGTYGTILTAREAAVMRFQSKSTAKLIVVAKHERSAQRCN